RTFDTGTLHPTGVASAGAGPTHVVTGPGHRAYVVDTRGDALISFHLRPAPHRVGHTRVAGTPYGIAIDAARGRLWITETARNRLSEWRLSGGEPSFVRAYPTVRQPNTVAVDTRTGRVFVAGAVRGQLELIDPR
ncbi:MAG TPA: hypothetical protein VGI54_02810, partial [Solirubrobacteraceae bacterium]